jgi:hypothetical protein
VKVRLYLDEDSMRQSLVAALRARGADIQTALDAGMIAQPDEAHLEYAVTEGRVLYSFNIGDYAALHSRWLSSGRTHFGVILAEQRQFELGRTLRALLKLIAERTSEQMRDKLEFLSQWHLA